jgi:hypothetical protein
VRNRRPRGVVLGLAALACIGVPATVVASGGGPATGQASLDKKLRVGVDSAGRPWYLGGFSALYPLDPNGHRFVTVTDRGPNAATNLLGGAYDEPATSPTLEQQYIPTTGGVVPPNPPGVTPGTKSLCVDVNAALTADGLVNQKLEGISVLRVAGRSVLAAVDDNDFDLAHVTDPADNPASLPTSIDFVPLPAGCS